MNNATIRLQSIELNNFKNIEHGKIDFNSYKKKTYYENKPEIIGIYGQNGSGKTSVINALELLKVLIEGKSLPENMKDYIYQLSDTTTLKFVFYIENKSKNEFKYLIDYEFSIKRENDSYSFSSEKLSYKEISGKGKTTIIEVNDANKKTPILPVKRYNELIRLNKENEIDIQVTKKICKKANTSFIFHEDIINMLENHANIDYFTIMQTLKYFITVNLFVISNKYSANTSLNFMPISFRIQEENKIAVGDIPVNLTKETSINKSGLRIVTKVLEQMNIVLGKIIRNLEVEAIETGKDFNDKGQELIKVEMFSIRGNIKVPLRYESEGIKKIISILSTLISVFNDSSVCLAVDELDSGIFEFLLGELLEILDKHGRGQIIFTSHNLRALEKLPKDSIIISTANSNNRFIRIPNVKASNNLRDIYLRSIDLGGLNEPIYESTSAYEISHAFRKAGIAFGKK